MRNKFLDLPKNEQRKIIEDSSQKLGRTYNVIEKDLWVCWVLEHLFKMPNALKMAFKGGTSLSKVFNLINRFSEDIDITIDYRELGKGFDFFSPTASKNSKNKMSDALKVLVSEYVKDIVVPHFVSLVKNQFGLDSTNVKVEQKEKVYIYYPTVTEDENGKNGYLGRYVLIEFGGRNITEPSETHTVHSDISEMVPELEFPSSEVNVLSPLRTFWEKATLIHVECNRNEFKANANRLSRHWYDLFMLSRSKVGNDALVDLKLLSDVIKYKKVFYGSSYANYDECLQGSFKLVPGRDYMRELEIDYAKMLNSGMFYGEEISFNAIIDEVGGLQKKINSLTS